jgi:hypothetical protein
MRRCIVLQFAFWSDDSNGKYDFSQHLIVSPLRRAVVETQERNLVTGMKWLQGACTQRFNRRLGIFGHLFQGHYKAVVIEAENRSRLLETFVGFMWRLTGSRRHASNNNELEFRRDVGVGPRLPRRCGFGCRGRPGSF